MDNSGLAVKQQVAIGGFEFLITTPNSKEFSPTLSGDYHHFVSNGVPEVCFNVSGFNENKSELETETIFDAGPNWQMHKSEGKYIVRTMFQEAHCSDDFLEVDIFPDDSRKSFADLAESLVYPLPEIVMINLLGNNNGILLHTCGIHDGDGVLLFCGMSGAGKSTLADLWDGRPGITVLSDDRVIVRKNDDEWLAYGTPWHGEAGYCSPISASVKKLFFIEHSEENSVSAISAGQSVSYLLARSFPPLWDKDLMENTLGYVHSLVKEVPSYILGVKPDDQVIDFIENIPYE